MLRRRGDKSEQSEDVDNTYNKLTDDLGKIQKDSVHSISSLSAVLLIIASVILFDIVVKLDRALPKPLTITDEFKHPGRFIAERAQNHLKQLVSLGPRVTGSYENEVLAVDFLTREINFILQQANKIQKIELDKQKVSGTYYLDHKPYGLVNVYKNVQNIIVRVVAAAPTNDSVLINCHFDSVPTSPGGSDDGINCVAMLEVLRVLSKEKLRPVHNIIFLFNGAEENPLQASHGFITQHKWAKEVRAVINLEAAGAGGRETLFQAGPGNGFLIHNYAKYAPHPHAQSSGEEIFQSNLIPSDTDFRVFRDYGRIPGLDFAFARNGYVYHTKYDGFDNIEGGSYQHVGDNLLAIVKSLSSSADLPYTSLDSKEKYVYFDFLGWTIFVYDEYTAFVINVSVIIVSVLIFFKLVFDLRHGSLFEVMVNVLLGGIAHIAGMLSSLFFAIVLAFLLDQFNATMSWYTRPKIIFGLYFCPTMIFLTIFLITVNHFIENINLSVGTRTQLHAHTTRMIWTFFLLVTTLFAIRSSYIFLIPVLFNTLSFVIISFGNLNFTSRTWLSVHLVCSIIPTIFSMYLVVVLLEVFIPVTGRFGSNRNPDDYIGIISAIGCFLITIPFLPLVTLLKKPSTIIAGLLMTFLITLGCILFTSYGFPYSENIEGPTPQRYWTFHTNRVFHDEMGTVKKQDSGFFLLNMDRNSPNIIEKYVPDIKNAVSIESDCKEYMYCGMPIYVSRMIQIVDDSTWIPAPPPVIHEPVTLRLQSKVNISETITRFSFQSTGPDHYSVFISPKNNVKVRKWSFMHEVPETTSMWNDRPTYFIMYGYGESPGHWNFSIDLETPPNWRKSYMDIAISGKYIHHDKTRSAEYNNFLKKFPPWTAVTAWMANYHFWRY